MRIVKALASGVPISVPIGGIYIIRTVKALADSLP